MGDVHCPKCGEPWDSYSLQEGIYLAGDGDLTVREATRFLAGEGCPSCHFGTACSACGGTGMDTGCQRCGGNGLRMAWSPSRDGGGYSGAYWYLGYRPHVIQLDENVEIVRPAEGFQCRDGWVRQAWVYCPDCEVERLAAHLSRDSAEPLHQCHVCRGSGKPQGGDADESIRELLGETDEEPLGVLERFTAGLD